MAFGSRAEDLWYQIPGGPRGLGIAHPGFIYFLIDKERLRLKKIFSRREFMLFLAALPLAGCTNKEIRGGITTARRVFSGDVAGAVDAYIPVTGVPEIDRLVRRQVHAMVEEIRKRWKDEKVPSETEYVKYTNEYQSRAIVNFDRGEIRVETLVEQQPRTALKEAIVTTLLTPENPSKVNLLSAQKVSIDGTPFLYQLVVDHEGQYIREQRPAERYADHLLQTAYRREPLGDATVHFVTFAMVREYKDNQQLKFLNNVRQNARRFDQPPQLIYAIMEAESSFNPYAMSHVPAYGLMQIVPSSAGRDAHQLIYGRDGTPSREYLFVPENNIRMGVAYLHILDTRYLKMVEDPASREFCVIAGYNTGSGNVLSAFDKNRSQAVNKINQMSPSDVYDRMLRHLPYQETRNYLPKVVGLKDKYKNVA